MCPVVLSWLSRYGGDINSLCACYVVLDKLLHCYMSMHCNLLGCSKFEGLPLAAQTLLFVLTEDSGHSQYFGAEEASDGPGYFHENSGLFLHSYFLWCTLQRGYTLSASLSNYP